MAQALTYIGGLIAFLALYAAVRRRAGRVTGEPQPIQWAGLAAVIGCAAVAIVIGVIMR